MKYYCLVALQYFEDKPDGLSVYTYPTMDEAIATFHRQFGGYMNKDGIKHIMCMVITEDGGIVKSESWSAQIPEPIPEPPVEEEPIEEPTEEPVEEVEETTEESIEEVTENEEPSM